jgi:hypothetical protein
MKEKCFRSRLLNLTNNSKRQGIGVKNCLNLCLKDNLSLNKKEKIRPVNQVLHLHPRRVLAFIQIFSSIWQITKTKMI